MRDTMKSRELRIARTASEQAGNAARAGTRSSIGGVIKPVTGHRRGWWRITTLQWEGSFDQGQKVGIWTYYSSTQISIRHTDIHFNL